MKTTYFFSSRTCSSKDQYKDYLLYLQNMSKDGTISLDKTDYLSQIRTFAKDTDKVAKYDNNKIIRRLLSRSLSDDYPVNDIIQSIEQNKPLLIQEGIISSTPQAFKTVYHLKSPTTDWMLFAVPEIDGTEEGVDEVRKQWCDLLIQYILKKEDSELKSIHLFLHDLDIPGYADLTQQLMDDVEKSCKVKKLISDDTANKVFQKKLTLTITFFKHTSTSCVMDIIGPNNKALNERVQDLPKAFEDAFDFMKGVGEAKRLANELKHELDKEENDA